MAELAACVLGEREARDAAVAREARAQPLLEQAERRTHERAVLVVVREARQEALEAHEERPARHHGHGVEAVREVVAGLGHGRERLGPDGEPARRQRALEEDGVALAEVDAEAHRQGAQRAHAEPWQAGAGERRRLRCCGAVELG